MRWRTLAIGDALPPDGDEVAESLRAGTGRDAPAVPVIGRVYPLGNGFKGLLSYLETGKDRAQTRAERVAPVGVPEPAHARPGGCRVHDARDGRRVGRRDPRTALSLLRQLRAGRSGGYAHAAPHRGSHDPRSWAFGIRGRCRRAPRPLAPAPAFRGEPGAPGARHALVQLAGFYRIERSLRAQERELGLTVVPGWLEPVRARDVAGLGVEVRDPEARVLPPPRPKHGERAFTDDRARVAPVLVSARSWAEAERGLAGQGLSLVVKGGGFRITDGRRDIKASDVAREFSRFHLEKRFGPYPDYRARMAVAESAPNPPNRRGSRPSRGIRCPNRNRRRSPSVPSQWCRDRNHGCPVSDAPALPLRPARHDPGLLLPPRRRPSRPICLPSYATWCSVAPRSRTRSAGSRRWATRCTRPSTRWRCFRSG